MGQLLEDKLMTKQGILDELKGLKLAILEENEKFIRVFDEENEFMSKEIPFYFNEFIHETLSERILLLSSENEINKEKLVTLMLDTMDHNLFITLENMYFIKSEDDLRKIYDLTGDEYALEIIDIEEQIGLMWYEKNSIIINLAAIKRVAEEIGVDTSDIRREYNIGILSTIIHELRHLMLDTNIILSEEDYPVEMSAENEVEEYCRNICDKIIYSYSYDVWNILKRKQRKPVN